MDQLKIKVCGMTDPANVREICKYHPDYIGYIFYNRSVRYVGEVPDPELFSVVPGGVGKTAVFVNEYYERMIDLTGRYGIDNIQLHGMESPETCRTLRMHGNTVIKVFPGNEAKNSKLLSEYREVVDYFLFDSPVRTYGGSGRKFDWSALSGLSSDIGFFLSGGVAPEDTELIKAIDIPTLYGIDINSRFETEPGLKDPVMVGDFLKAMRDGK
jgi:phosphoribosylanthranilate isomerase